MTTRSAMARLDWWSATGNTARAAEEIRLGLEDAGWTCRFERVDPRAREAPDFTNVKLWLLASPIFDFRVALPVSDFVARCRPPSGMPVAAVVTMAGTSDRSLTRLAALLRRVGARPWLWRELVCEESWPLARRFLPAFDRRGEPSDESLAALRAWSASLPRLLEEGRPPVSWWRVPTPLTPLAWLYHPAILRRTFPLRVDEARCTRCGACARVCPEERIRLAPFPVAEGDCVGCYGCVNACPVDALDTWLTRGAPRYRGPRRPHGHED